MADFNFLSYIVPKKVGNVFDKVYVADLPTDKDGYASYEITDYARLCGASAVKSSGTFGSASTKILPMPSSGANTGKANRGFHSIIPTIQVNVYGMQSNPDFAAAVHPTNWTFTFGDYPQTIAANSRELEDVYQRYYAGETVEDFGETGRMFTGYHAEKVGCKQNPEFVYQGKKYVRVAVSPKADSELGFNDVNGEIVEWCEVEPVVWKFKTNPFKAGKNGAEAEVCCTKAIMGGLPFHPTVHPGAPYWENSTPRGFLNGLNLADIKNKALTNLHAPDGGNFYGNGFLDDLQSASFEDIREKIEERQQAKRQAYVAQKLSPDEQLKTCIDAGQSVFLHGPSGVGKSARVKTIDPTATRITLRPQMNPEEIDGTLNRETGQYIPPLWYTELCRKCEAEPNRKHVLFIDELTNVKPTVQSLVYSIVLDRAGKDGLWPLPDNAVVVAAGNEKADNLAAFPMTNALFRRFNHVYYEVDKASWLDWAAGVSEIDSYKPKDLSVNIPPHMHPYVLEYVRSRGKKVLYQDLDEENPKIVTDPRKWEIASRLLYATHNLMAIEPAVGKAMTDDFVDFVTSELPRIAMNSTYDDKVIDMDVFGPSDNYDAYATNIQTAGVLEKSQRKFSTRENGVNPYGFSFDDLDDDQLLAAYIEAGQSVFLHGASGVGKSARVREIDPTATRITLRPQMNPEEIDGTLDRETGQYIPPLWYTDLCKKCEAEPNRKHVLFIDELTNVKPTVQSLVYSIVLDRAGKDGLWPLPDNAVVIAAGNESSNNLAAEPLTNALFRRFNHIYYDVNVNDWLEWGLQVEKEPVNLPPTVEGETRARIHPAIIAYIMSRSQDVLNQDLNEEDPKIVTDPRKWAIASDILYTTKNPKALLPAIGRELTADFVGFVQMSTLTPADILTGKAKAKDFTSADIATKLANISGLVEIDAEDLPAIRSFIGQGMGREVLATYDSMWIKNDPERAVALENVKKGNVKQKAKRNPFTVVEEDEEEQVEQQSNTNEIVDKINERHETKESAQQTQQENEDKKPEKRRGIFGRFK